jgi:hypothetical protein
MEVHPMKGPTSMKSRSIRRASVAAGAALVLAALSPVLSAPAASAAEPTISISSNEVLDLGFDGDLTDATTKHTVSMQTGTASYVAGADGVANHALDFTGSSALNLGTAADLQPTDLTLSFWYKPDADMGSGEQVFAWSKYAYNDDGWYLTSPSSTVPLALSVGPDTAASNPQPYLVQTGGTRSTFFPTGQWTHVVVTYDHTSKAVTFYRNGVKQTSTVLHATTATATGVLGSEGTTVKTIGYNGPDYHTSSSYIHGAMDDYRLYNGVATTADVVKLTQENNPSFDPKSVATSDLAALSLPATATNDITLPTSGQSGSAISWSSSDTSVISNTGTVHRPSGSDASVTLTATATYAGSDPVTQTFTVKVLEAASSATEPTISVSPNEVLDLGFDTSDLTDSTGKHTPTMIGTASYVAGADGGSGKALDLNGTSSAVTLGTNSDLQPQDLTVSYWFKPDADMGTGEQVFAWSKGNTYDLDGWYLTSLNGTTPVALSVGPSVTNGQPYEVGVTGTRSTFFPTGQWTHVVVTYDHTSKTVTFYRNGVKQTSTVLHAISGASTGVLGSDSTTKAIGYNGPNYHGAYVHGALDDYRLYNGVATTADVVKLTQENEPSFDPKSVATSDLAALTVPTTTTANLTLPTAGAGGSTIAWSSDKTSVIGNDGTVTRPTGSDATVTLTATATYGGGTATRTFTVTVPADNTKPQADLDALTVPSTVAADFTLATTGSVNGSAISWSSSDSSLISISGGTATVHQPSGGDATVTLTASAVYDGGGAVTKTFTVTVTADNRATQAQADLDAITTVPTSATANFTVPTTGSVNGSTISWSSDKTSVISISGGTATVVQPTGSAATVTLTASAVYDGGAAVTKTFTVTVPAAAATEPSLSISSKEVLSLGLDGDLSDATSKHTVSMQTGTASYVAGADGVANHALDFTGSSALNLGASSDLQPTDLTLSFWFKPDADMGTGEQVFAWSKGATWYSDGWYLTSADANRPVALSVGPAASGGQPYLAEVTGTRSTFFPTGQWTHIVVTYDHTSKAVTFYRNGVKQTTTVQYPISSTSTGVIGSDSTTKTIGYSGPGYAASFLKGALDDYRLYSGVATTADVVKLTQENLPSFDPSTVATSDLAALSVPASTTSDLTLATTGASGSTITWSSNKTSVIGDDGTVTQPSGSDATVTLTATATYGGGTATRTFTVTVPADNSTALAQADLDALTVPSSVSADFTVPTTGSVNGSTITWTSSNTAVIAISDGSASVSRSTSDATVTLTASAVNGGGTAVTKTFTVTVLADTTPLAQADLDALTVPSSVSADFTVPTTGSVNGSTITWTSSNTAVIAISGGSASVHQPTDHAVTLTLTAHAVNGGGTAVTRKFTVTVPADTTTLSQADLDAITIDHAGDLTADFVLPDTGVVNGSDITWTSSDPSVIAISDGVATVHRPKGSDVTVTLTASAAYNGDTEVVTKEFTVTVTGIPTTSPAPPAVTQAASTTTLKLAKKAHLRHGVAKVKATVTVKVAGGGVATGTVRVVVKGKTYTVTLKNGKAKVWLKLKKAKKYAVTATYAGTAQVLGSQSAKRTIKVTKH